MGSIFFFLRWGWLFSLALLAPITLPAGGWQRVNPSIKKADSTRFFACNNCWLRSSPIRAAPILTKIDSGTNLQVLRNWVGEDGNHWLKVRIKNGIPSIFASLDVAQRGWIRVQR